MKNLNELADELHQVLHPFVRKLTELLPDYPYLAEFEDALIAIKYTRGYLGCMSDYGLTGVTDKKPCGSQGL